MSKSLAFKKGVRVSKLSFVYVLAVAIPLFSLLYGWMPILHKFFYICAVACLLTLLLVPRFYVTKQALLSFFYLAVVIANIMSGDEFAQDKQLLDGLILIMSTGVSYYLLEANDIIAKKWIIIFVFSILILQTIISVPIYLANQGAIRELIEMQYRNQNRFEIDYLFRMGIVNYDMIHALPILVAPLVMWLRKKNLKLGWKLFLAISLVCILTLSFVYESTTVQLLSFYALVASFIIHKTNMRKSSMRIVLLMVMMLPFLSSESAQTGVLGVVEKAEWGEISHKAKTIKQDIESNIESSDLATRTELYEMSLMEFLNSPIWGSNKSNNIGGHSVIFDRMGAFGLIGIVPFILVIILVIKFSSSLLPLHVNEWYYLICVFCFVMVLLFKGINALEIWLVFCVVSPCLLTMNEEIMIRNKVVKLSNKISYVYKESTVDAIL